MKKKAYQRFFVKAWNKLASFLFRNQEIRYLNLEKIIAKVEKSTGKKIDISDTYFEPVKLLVNSINKSGKLTPFGAFYIEMFISGLLESRYQLEKLWELKPEILKIPIVKPMIILGLPRSGTTFLFNLLSCDSQYRFITNWEAIVSQIPSKQGIDRSRDMRRKIGKILIFLQNYLAPNLKNIHKFYLDGPEECTTILMQGFSTQAIDPMFPVSEYSRHLDNIDLKQTYQHFKKVLQTLQWHFSKTSWLLKSPDHLGGIEEVLNQFPDVRLIHLHRDPAQSVSSWASLNVAFQGIWLSEINYAELGMQVLNRLSIDMKRYLKIRTSIKDEQIVDISYKSLVKDPLAVVESIYRHFNMPLTEETRNNMQKFLSKDKKIRHEHVYTAQDFSLSPQKIHEMFDCYMQRFNIEIDKA